MLLPTTNELIKYYEINPEHLNQTGVDSGACRHKQENSSHHRVTYFLVLFVYFCIISLSPLTLRHYLPTTSGIMATIIAPLSS